MTARARSRLVAAAACLAALASAPAADAATKSPPLRPAGEAAGIAFSDGTSQFAFPRPDGRIEVIGRDGSRTRLTPPPSQCEGHATQARAIGSGKLVFDVCNGSDGGHPVVVDIGSGKTTDVGMLPPPQGGMLPYEESNAIGTRWIETRVSVYHGHYYRYVDWHTGRVRERQATSARLAPDLGEPSLYVRMCAPLHRRQDPNGDPYDTGPPLLQYQYSRPFGLTLESRDGPLVLDRCGRRTKPLANCATYACYQPQLGGGYVTWLVQRRDGGAVAHAYRIRDGRRFVWRQKGIVAVAHVRGMVVITRSNSPSDRDVLVARVPR